MPAPISFTAFSKKYSDRIELPVGEHYIQFGNYKYALKVAEPTPGTFKKECYFCVKLTLFQVLKSFIFHPLDYSTWLEKKYKRIGAELRTVYKDNLEEIFAKANHIIQCGCDLSAQMWLKAQRENDPSCIKIIPFGPDFETTGILTTPTGKNVAIAAQDIIIKSSDSASETKNAAQQVGGNINGNYCYLDERVYGEDAKQGQILFNKITGKGWTLAEQRLFTYARNEVWEFLKPFSQRAIKNSVERLHFAINPKDSKVFSDMRKTLSEAMDILRGSDNYLNMCFEVAKTRESMFSALTEYQIADVKAMLIFTEKRAPDSFNSPP